jgi:hypothetical protein
MPQPSPSRKRLRRWGIAAVVILLLFAVAWHVFKRIADVDQYRAPLMALVTEKTGFPIHIDRLDANLRPLPALRAYGVRFGEGEFLVEAESVTVHVDLLPLLAKVIAVSEVSVEGGAWTLPEDLATLGTYLDRNIPQNNDADDNLGSGWSGSLGTFDAQGIQIFIAGDTEPSASADVTLEGVLSEKQRYRFTTRLPAFGEDMSLKGDFTLLQTDAGDRITGSAKLDDLALRTLSDHINLPDLSTSIELRAADTTFQEFVFDFAGVTEALGQSKIDANLLAGTFQGRGKVEKTGKVIINGFQHQAPGITLEADATRQPDGALAIRVNEAMAANNGLDPLLAMLPQGDIRLAHATEALVEIDDFLVGINPGVRPRLVSGRATFTGLSLARADGSTFYPMIRGSMRVREDVLLLEEIRGLGDLTLRGEVRPDWSTRHVAFALDAEHSLKGEHLTTLLPESTVTEIGGRLDLDAITGTYVPKEGVPDDLRIEGRISDGLLTVQSKGGPIELSTIQLEFDAASSGIRTTLKAESNRIGPIALSGTYDARANTWRGTYAPNVSQLVDRFMPERPPAAEDVIALYAGKTYQVDITLPEKEGDGIALGLHHDDGPKLDVSFAFEDGSDGWKAGLFTLDTAIPAEALAQAFPAHMPPSGTVRVHGDRPKPDVPLIYVADFGDTRVPLGEGLAKRQGDPLTARLATAPAGWVPETFTIAFHGAALSARLEDGNAVFPEVDVDAAAFASLLPEGSETTGRITGVLSTKPPTCDLQLADVGLRMPPSVNLQSANGRVAYDSETWTFDNCSFRGENSAFTVSARGSGMVWDGKLRGDKLDLGALMSLADAAGDVRGSEEFADTVRSPQAEIPDAGKARFDITLDTLLYEELSIDEVHAEVLKEGRGLYIRDLALGPPGRKTTGTVSMMWPEGDGPPQVDLDILLEEAELGLLDAALFKPPRGIRGRISGPVKMAFPYVPGENPLSRATGTADLTGKKGSLGSVGLANAVLRVLRTTEILRGRLPKRSDSGLSFDTLTAKVTADAGLISVEECLIDRPSIAFSTTGTFDFPNDTSDAKVDAYILNLATGVVSKVPLIGRAVADTVNNMTRVRVNITGSPTSPKVGLARGQSIESIGESVESAGEQGGDIVLDALEGLLNGALDTAEPPAESP